MGITASMPMQTRIHIQLVLHPRITMPKGVLGLVLIEVMLCCVVQPSNPPHLISHGDVDNNDTGTDFDALKRFSMLFTFHFFLSPGSRVWLVLTAGGGWT